MQIDLTGKTALVTGSTAGIGRAIAEGLAKASANVVVNGRKQTTVDKAVAAVASEAGAPRFAAWRPMFRRRRVARPS